MRVAAVQFRALKGRPEESLTALAGLAERAAAGSDLVVLPEMGVTGYVFPTVEEAMAVAEPARGPLLAALAPIARANACWMVAGFPERDGDVLYNSALVVDRGGELVFVYRKTLLYALDETWALPGDSGYATFDTGSGRFGVGICMDLNDDRFTDWLDQSGVRALAFPTNWVEEGIDVWGYWAFRVLTAKAALVAANTWGLEEGVEFSGRSAVIDGTRVLGSAGKTGDGVVRAVLG